MATMKDFLRSSIMAGGSVAAAPSGQTVSISAKSSVGEWAEICNFVSPNNGYVQVRGINTELGAVSTIFVDSGYVCAPWSGSGLDLGYFLPVKRGDTVNVFGSHLKNVTVVLRVLGGAKSPVAQLFWRVVPCLRTCLTRVSTRTLKAKRTGSGSNLFRLPQPSNINGHRAIGMKSFLLKRGGFPFELRLLGTLKPWNLVLPRTIRPFQCQPYPGTMDTSERPFLSGKGFRSNSRSQGTSLRPVFTSGFIGLRAEPNLCFGGASYE